MSDDASFGSPAEEQGSEPLAPNAFEAALDAVITMDGDGCVRSFNRAAEEAFGFSRQQVVGKPVADFIIPPKLRAAHWSGVARLRAGGRSRLLGQRVELIAMRADGSEFPVELRIARLSADPLLFIGFIRDVSEHSESEERARRLQELLIYAEQATHVGSWELSPASEEVVWSNETYRIFGYEPGAVTPGIDLVLERIHPEDRPEVQGAIQAALAGSAPQENEYRIVRPDGMVRTVTTHLVSRDEGTGPPTRLTGTIQDITESRAREREVEGYYAVGQALVDWQAEEGVGGLLQRLARAMDWAVAALWTPDPGERVIRCRGLWTAPGVDAEAFEDATRQLTFAKGQGLPGQAWKTGAPVSIEDVTGEPDSVRDPHAEAAGLHGALAIPALRDDEVVAVLEFLARERRAPTPGLGRALSVIRYQLGYILERRRAAIEPAVLTARELEVLALAGEGLTSQRIAERLVISPETVKSHLRSVYAKLDVKDRAEAVGQAVRWGLIK
jgi:PAS domain S-box-containing protein